MEKIYYGPLELPSGAVIKFRRPTGMDKILVTKKAKMNVDRLNDLVLVQQFSSLLQNALLRLTASPQVPTIRRLLRIWTA